MGSSSSKPSDSSPHVWKGSQTGVSQNLVEQLETSNETDVSRLQSLELQIQARVAAELKRLRAQEADALREAQQKLSEPSTTTGTTDQPETAGGQDRQKVARDIADLRAKLEKHRGVRADPESLQGVRNELVRCLRENDRRPLDCWREVEAFKEEVRRLEKGWVDKVVS